MISEIYKFICTCVFYSLLSCSIADEQCIVTEKYNGGEPETIVCVNNKTGDEYFTRFYPSGKLKARVQTKDSLPHGITVAYYENGDTASILSYKKGVLHGFQRWFQLGYLTTINQYKEGVLIGEEYKFNPHENGKLYHYIYRNNDSEILYHSFFDEQGCFVIDTGLALLNLYTSSNSKRLHDYDTLSIGDTVGLITTVANPYLDGLNITIKCLIENTSQGSKTEQLLSIGDNYLNIPHQVVLNNEGLYNISVIVERINSSNYGKRMSYSEVFVFAKCRW